MVYFRRMFEIESGFHATWWDMNFIDSMSKSERSQLAVWDFPVTTKYTKLWSVIRSTGMPSTIQEGVERVRKSTPDDGFALLGDGLDLRYYELSSCDLKTVGTDYARKPAAMALQEGSPLKEPFDNA